MSMYKNARSLVRVNGKIGEEFEVKVGVHQGLVFRPILFAIVLKALSRGFSAGLPWELLYADNVVIMADSLDEQCEAGKMEGRVKCQRSQSKH